MFLNHILLGFLGIAFGGAVAAGTFAFVIVIGVVPRMIGKCNRAANTLCFEQAIILGGILGNIVSVFLQMHIPLGQVSGHIFLGLYGLSAGMFVGCIAVLSRSFNLYSDVQRADDIVVILPAEAGEKHFDFEERVKLVNPRITAEGYKIGTRGFTNYILHADDMVKA